MLSTFEVRLLHANLHWLPQSGDITDMLEVYVRVLRENVISFFDFRCAWDFVCVVRRKKTMSSTFRRTRLGQIYNT